MHRSIPFALLAASLLTACSTELDINEPYKDITIVYGLLNQKDSVHFVKINKAFLGEGNALDMALVQDSSEYSGEAISYAKVFRVSSSGALLDSFPLLDTTVVNREPGTFYAPVQKLKYFTTSFTQVLPPGSLGTPMYLWQDDSYRLVLVVNGSTITAETPITNDFKVDPVDQDTVANGARVNLRNIAGDNYSDYEFNWTSRADCKRFVVSWRMRYDEVTGTDTVARSISQKIGSPKVSSFVNEDMAVRLSGTTFYPAVESLIKSQSGWQSVERRIFRGMDFVVSVANDDLHTYLTLTEPVTGIVNDRPAYSNLENAIGVWGSRYEKTTRGKRLSTQSFQELINGPYTGDLHFCSPQDAFPCP
ncbi:MAG: DUF4249 family protein [Flavobacteriales bacterium]|nr:DUF4249 family protein [Flavobacteriales bacterium]